MAVFHTFLRTYARWVHRRPAKVISAKNISALNELNKVDLDILNKLSEQASDNNYKNEVLSRFNPKKSDMMEHKQRNNDDRESKMQLNNSAQYNNGPTHSTLAINAKEHTKYKTPSVKKYEEKQFQENNITEKTIQKDLLYDNTKSHIRILVDPETNLNYIKLNKGDVKLSSMMLAVKSRKRREQTQQILLEGKRLVRDALQANLKLEALLFSKMGHLKYFYELLKPYNTEDSVRDNIIFKVSNSDISLWSDVVTTPGIMGLFARPPQIYSNSIEDVNVPIIVVCDNITDPTNMGTVIRTCAALPCQRVILTKGCCDPWDTKVLRGGAGGHFRLTIIDDMSWDNIKEYIPENSTIFVADSNCNKIIENFPSVPYDTMKYKSKDEQQPIVIIMGGETYGISDEAYKLCQLNKGIRLNIPLAEGVDSLNTSTALSILMFEIRRQLLNMN